MTDIFVFGSNTEGRHGKGAALYARLNYGAVYGRAEGLQGASYAIITKELRNGYPKITVEDIERGVERLLRFAADNPEFKFNITRIGGGLAGFDFQREIEPLFKGMPGNCKFISEY
jgi:hypothetical protein